MAGLKQSPDLKRFLEARLCTANGIDKASASILTGNLLVRFNSHHSHQDIADIIEGIIDGAEEFQEAAHDGGDGAEAPLPAPTPETVSWHTLEPETILDRLGTGPETGLSRSTADTRLNTYGLNRLPEVTPRSGTAIFLEQFNSLPVALLGVAAGFSLLTGALLDAAVIAGVVTTNAIIGYFMESRAEATIQSLAVSAQPPVEVIRDGDSREVSAESLVPGDLLVLKKGDQVAADCRLVAVSRLSIDESSLTGESVPVMKETGALSGEEAPLGDRTNMAFQGTLITGGSGLGVVTATGKETQMGRIQALFQGEGPPETPIERQLRRIGNHLVYFGLSIGGLLFLVGLLRGYSLLRIAQTAVSVAAAAVPEGLPTTATVTFALGIHNLKRRRVILRRLEAVVTLGTIQTLCLDKTGTITENRMTVTSVYAGMQSVSVKGDEWRIETGPVDPERLPVLQKLLQICALCSEAEIGGDSEGEEITLAGSSTENALIRAAMAAGIDVGELRRDHPTRDIRPRTKEALFMATTHGIRRKSDGLLAIKGSPDQVLEMCDRIMIEGEPVALADDLLRELEAANRRMAGEGLRLLGAACKLLHNGERETESVDFDSDLVFLGLVGMADPVREGIHELIQVLHRAGIDTVMITGDQSATAQAVGRDLDLGRGDHLEVMDSADLMDVETDALEALSRKVHVYARVSPEHKLKIVQSLQSGGRVVAMTGDGINDGPALKAADIGIVMGRSGTGRVRDMGDVVLEQDNLESLIEAIRDGRTIHGNIKKAVHFFLSTNLTEMMMIFTGISAGMGSPLNTMQLLWINLISDIFPAVTYALEPPEPDIMDRPPRDPAAPLFSNTDYRRMGREAAVITGGAMSAYLFGLLRYGAGGRAGTLAFQSLTVGQLLHTLNCRSEIRSVFDDHDRPRNPYLDGAVAGAMLLQIATLLVPGLRQLLGLSRLGLSDLLVTGAGALVPMLINEAVKPATAKGIAAPARPVPSPEEP